MIRLGLSPRKRASASDGSPQWPGHRRDAVDSDRNSRECAWGEDTMQGANSKLSNLFLILGAGIIIASIVYTSAHLRDHVIFTRLVPGVVLGLLLIGGYVVFRRRGN